MFNIEDVLLTDVLHSKTDGLVFIGCGGDTQVWCTEACTFLLEEKAINNLECLKEVKRFEIDEPTISPNPVTCLFFPFKLDASGVNINRLAIARLHIADFCKWKSDFSDWYKLK